ncbi:ion channel [Camelimonas fluminis]|uniref:Ion channel n=1 Tax=Camelimonas fluminis TaxID=1576911 RepID=A0ABV7ULH4_9HYPH|nr:ion channel [Camelimonas fluminis]
MMQDFLIGSFVSILVMLAHLAGTLLIVSSVERIRKRFTEPNPLSTFITLTVVYIILSCMLFASVGIWATLYIGLNLVDGWGNAFYSALVNYTTLGFGDLVQASRTRIYGPMAAASGILMFSWAAAILVYVLQAHLPAMIRMAAHSSSKKGPTH